VGGGGGIELAAVQTFLEFHILIQTNILANHLSINTNRKFSWRNIRAENGDCGNSEVLPLTRNLGT